MQNTPCHISSADPQMLRANVYQIAIKAAPRRMHIRKPIKLPIQICLIRRLCKSASSNDFLTKERRTETMIAASSVSNQHGRETITSKNYEENWNREDICRGHRLVSGAKDKIL